MENRTNGTMEDLFNRESYLDQKKLNDDSKLGLGFRINNIDNLPYFYLVLLRHERRIEYGPKFEKEEDAYETYDAISSTADFERRQELCI